MTPEPDSEIAQWFSSEVQPHASAVKSYLYGIAEHSEVEDLMQESYARILGVRRKRTVRSVRGLFFAIARNLARDSSRRRAVAKTTAVAEIHELPVYDESPSAPEVVGLRQEVELLQAAIQALPERCRAVLILRKLENLSHREIAHRLGIAEHTVEAQLTKGLKRCEAYFEKHGALPPP